MLSTSLNLILSITPIRDLIDGSIGKSRIAGNNLIELQKERNNIKSEIFNKSSMIPNELGTNLDITG